MEAKRKKYKINKREERARSKAKGAPAFKWPIAAIQEK
jgi:hypothetical protein